MYILATTVNDKTSRLYFSTEKEAKETKNITEIMLEDLELEFEIWIYEQEQENGESFTDYESGERFY